MATFKITTTETTMTIEAPSKEYITSQLGKGSYLVEELKAETKKPTDQANKQKIWVDSDDAYNLGVTVASGTSDSLSSGGSWFTRKVTNIALNDWSELEGIIKLNKRGVIVQKTGDNEWRIA